MNERFIASWASAGVVTGLTDTGLPLKQLNQLSFRGYTAEEAGAIIIWLRDRARGYPCAHFGLGPLGGICPHCKCIFDKGDLPC